jgi:pyridoxine 5-phosphate synthase
MIALSVNLNKIALLRNSRSGNFPSVIEHAKICIAAGANGITVHPRPDQRHIRPGDVADLHTLLKQYPDIEFNIEGNPFSEKIGTYPGFMQLIEQYPPHQCTLVPDTSDQLTSDHGFDLSRDQKRLKPLISRLKQLGIRVSLFMEPDLKQISLAADIGSDRIELYTGPFASAYADQANPDACQKIFDQHCQAAEHSCRLGLGLNAGHDLNLENLTLYRTLPHLQEVSIGHALTVDALHMGLIKTITAYRKVLRT